MSPHGAVMWAPGLPRDRDAESPGGRALEPSQRQGDPGRGVTLAETPDPKMGMLPAGNDI